MAEVRSASVVISAKIDQYTSNMSAAAKATESVADAADRAGRSVDASGKSISASSSKVSQASQKVTDARRQEQDAAARLNTAEKKLDEVKKNSSSTASQIARAEEQVVTSRNRLEKSTETLSSAERDYAKASTESAGKVSGFSKAVQENASEMSTAGKALTVFGAGIIGAGVAAGKSGVEFNNLKQISGAAMKTLTGSTSEANAQMDKLNEFGSKSWIMRDVLLRAQQQMVGFGIETEKVIPYMDGLAEAVAATGGSSQQFEELAFVMSKVQSRGKLTANTFNEFGMRGVDAATIIGEQMGQTADEIRDGVTSGTLDAEEALDALAAGMKEKYAGASDNVRDTFRGAIDNVMAGWRDLSSEMMSPLVDPDGGGLGVSGLNVFADALAVAKKRAEEMPDAMKITVGALGGTAGAASLAAGGFLLLAPRILETKKAYDKLAGAGGILGATTQGLGKVGKAAGIAAGAFVALELAAASYNAMSTKPAVQGVEDITNELLKAADGGDAAADALDKVFKGKDGGGLTRDVDDLGTAINDVMYKNDGFNEWINKNLGGDAINAALGTVGKAETQFRDLDESMAGLVSSGSAEEASNLFARVAQKFEDQGHKARDAMEFFPELRKEYQGIANELKINVSETELFNWMMSGEMPPAVKAASDAANEGSDAIKGVGDSAKESAEGLKEMLEGLFDLGLATLSERDAMRNYEEAIDGVTDSVKENGRTLDTTTEKGRNNEAAFDAIADAGFRAADSMAENGASHEEVQKHLERTRDDLIDAAHEFGITGSKAEDLADKVMGIPKGVNIETWMSDAAKKTAQDTGDEIAAVGQMEPKPKIKADNTDAMQKVRDSVKAMEDADGTETNFFIKVWRSIFDSNDDGRAKKSGSGRKGVENRAKMLKDPFANHDGNILTPMAAGGFAGAEMVRPNTWRIVGDRMDVDEAYIPLDGSKRSRAILMEALDRMPNLTAMASGGIVGRAESRLADAQRRLDSINQASRKVTAEDRRRDAAQKRVDDARAALDRAKEAEAKRERVASLQSDLRQDVRRGSIRDQVTGSLSGGYSAVDRLAGLGDNEDLSRGSRSRANSSARKFEANLKSLYAQAERIDAKLKSAQDKAQELKGIKDTVVSSLLGGRDLDVGTYQQRVGGEWSSYSNLGQAAKSMRMDVGAMKAFAGKLKKLTELGIPGAIIQEIAQAGVVEGSNMADSFIDATAAERKSYLGAWSDYEKYANQAGQYVTEGFHKGGAAAADGVVKGLEGKQKNVEAAIANLAKAMESTFKQVLGIHSPSRVTGEIGEFTVEGLVQSMLGGVGDVQSAAAMLGAAAVPSVGAMSMDVGVTPVVADDEGLAGLAMQDMSATTLEAMEQMRLSVSEGWAQMLADTQLNQAGMLLGTQENQTGMLTALQAAQLGMLTDTQAKQAAMLSNTQTQQEAMRATVLAKQTGQRTASEEQQEAMRLMLIDKQSQMKSKSATDFESLKNTTGAKFSAMRSATDTTMSGMHGDYSTRLESLKGLNQRGFESLLSTSNKNMEGVRDGIDAQMAAARPELGGRMNDLISVLAKFTTSVNKAFGDVGVKLDAPKPLKYADGGVMPGYTPGRDVHHFRSQSAGDLYLSGGEGIIRPETVRMIGGEKGVHALNAAARRGDSDSVTHMLGGMAFANGGVVPRIPGVNAFADAGVWRNLWAITRDQFPNARLTSAYRGGSTTVSGNRSYHSRGMAIDVSPSMDIFNFWRNKYGANLAELIYSPANGKQIKNGQNHYYTGAVRGMHFNHVHIAAARALSDAMAGGLPGMGGAMSHPFLDRAGVTAGSDLQAAYAKAAEKLTSQIYAKHASQLPDGIAGQLGKGIMSQVSEGLVGKAKEYGKTTAISGTTAGDPAVKAAVRKIAEQMGWGDYWGDIDWLVNKESSWNPNAANPSSSARGLFQKMTSLHGPVEDTVEGQARWGLNYIKSTYGNPAKARAHHQRSNWYEGGTERAKRGLAVVGEEGPELVNFQGGEQVLSRADSMKFMAANRTYIPNTGGPQFDQAAFTTAVAGAIQANGINPNDLADALSNMRITFNADGQQFTGAVTAVVGAGYDQSRSRLSKSSQKIGAR